MLELKSIQFNDDRITLSARELHEFLEATERFSSWFNRMTEYGFEEDVEFTSVKNFTVVNNGAKRELQDYQITLDMAKELAMLQRNEKGKQARQYFIQLEKEWNSPEKVMARALQLANTQILELKVNISRLAVDVQIMKPKAEYFDELVDRNLLTNFRETAKELKVKEKEFVGFLLDKKYVFRNQKGKLEAYAKKNDGLFEMKESYNQSTGWKGVQTLITPKGRETFRLLLSN